MVVGDGLAIVGRQQVFPLGVAVRIGVGLTIDRFARQGAAVVVIERGGVAVVARRDGGQLVTRKRPGAGISF